MIRRIRKFLLWLALIRLNRSEITTAGLDIQDDENGLALVMKVNHFEVGRVTMSRKMAIEFSNMLWSRASVDQDFRRWLGKTSKNVPNEWDWSKIEWRK